MIKYLFSRKLKTKNDGDNEYEALKKYVTNKKSMYIIRHNLYRHIHSLYIGKCKIKWKNAIRRILCFNS